MNPNSPERAYHEATYGPLEKFGYKDFIPMFTGAKFDADAWADLFRRAGARFAGPVAEHHDGFSMWDTAYSEWNAAKMGPKRDIVGELSVAIKKAGLKFVTAFHHAENWYFFPVWDKRYDCGDPRYSGLYGPIHEKGAQPDKAFLDRWAAKVREVIDKYRPDFLWFDFGLGFVPETYKRDLLAHFLNTAAAEGREVVVSYKDHDLPPGVGINDLELGQEREMTYHEWITDSSVDNQGAWGYVRGAGFKTTENLVHNLMDRISKNGYLLLNVGPKPDGTIPEEAKADSARAGPVARGQRRGRLRHQALDRRRRGSDQARRRGGVQRAGQPPLQSPGYPLHGQGRRPLRHGARLARREDPHQEPGRRSRSGAELLERPVPLRDRLGQHARRRPALEMGDDQRGDDDRDAPDEAVRLRLCLQDREARAVLSRPPSGLREAGGLTRSRGRGAILRLGCQRGPSNSIFWSTRP